MIERAVIATTGGVLRLPNAELQMQPTVGPVLTLADAERAHIRAALRETNGVVGGWDGAAARLGCVEDNPDRQDATARALKGIIEETDTAIKDGALDVDQQLSANARSRRGWIVT